MSKNYQKRRKTTIKSQALGGIDLSGVIHQVNNPPLVFLLSHNASGDLNNRLIRLCADYLTSLNFASIRYNFHYVGRFAAKVAKWEDVVLDCEAAYKKAKEIYPKSKYCLLGKSLGALVSLYLLSKYPTEIKTAVLFSVPLSAVGNLVSLDRLSNVTARVIVFQGDKDRFGTPQVVKEKLKNYVKDLVINRVKNGEHSFEKDFNRKQLEKVVAEMGKALQK